MKRSWTTIVLFAGLIGLLVLLGALQYQWQTQISQNESERMHKRVQEEADRFASDFNREIQNAYFNFQTDADTWKVKNWREFNERYAYWLGKAQYPKLIDNFYFLETKGNALPLRYNAENRTFETVEWDQRLQDIHSRFTDPNKFSPVSADIYTLLLPIHESERRIETVILKRSPVGPPPVVRVPATYGYLAIELDENVIKENILPDLIRDHFTENDFNISIVDKDQTAVFASQPAANGIDAKAGMFDVSPDNFIFYANKDLVSSDQKERKDRLVINSRIESHTLRSVQTESKPNSTVSIEVKPDERPKTSVFTTVANDNKPPWTLMIQHRDGSIDAFLANRRFRNLGMGFGILLLLGGAISAIIFSAQRAKMLAQRQIDFVSSVSHEFRTPLAVIYSAGENLADGVAKEDGQVSKYGDLIKGEGRKLSAMVEQILDFAGANSGRKKYNFSKTAVGDVVKDAINECRHLLNEKNITLDTDIPASLPTIDADRKALSQAVQNLIANSVKYSNRERWIRVSAENGGNKIKLAVEDRGMGISKKDLRQIFQPFYRSKEVVDAQIHGNGLGLSLVKQIAEAHNGRVIVESEPGRGSRFVIEIPAQSIK